MLRYSFPSRGPPTFVLWISWGGLCKYNQSFGRIPVLKIVFNRSSYIPLVLYYTILRLPYSFSDPMQLIRSTDFRSFAIEGKIVFWFLYKPAGLLLTPDLSICKTCRCGVHPYPWTQRNAPYSPMLGPQQNWSIRLESGFREEVSDSFLGRVNVHVLSHEQRKFEINREIIYASGKPIVVDDFTAWRNVNCNLRT